MSANKLCIYDNSHIIYQIYHDNQKSSKKIYKNHIDVFVIEFRTTIRVKTNTYSYNDFDNLDSNNYTRF